MKSFLIVFAILLHSTSIFSQAVRAKDFVIQANYGIYSFPYYFEDDIPTGAFSINTKVMHPTGLLAEYFIADRISIGIDANLKRTTRTYSKIDPVYNFTTGLDENIQFDYLYEIKQLRLCGRIDYHIANKSTKFDFYGGIGVGLKYTFENSFKNKERIKLYSPLIDDLGIGFYSLRLCLGGRYFITRKFGISTEIGLGGALVNAGLFVKL
jgi:hypothetical protein